MFLSSKKLLLVPLAVVLLLVLLCVLSLATVNSDFVKRKIAERIEESAHATTEIGKVEVNPFVGKLALRNVKIAKQKEGCTFDLVADSVTAEVCVKKLIYRDLDFVAVRIEKPVVTVVRTDGGISQAAQMFSVADLIMGKAANPPKPEVRKKEPKEGLDFVIHDLRIVDGGFTYQEVRGDKKTAIELRNLQYDATEVSISRFYRLVVGANIEGELVTATGKGTFKKIHGPGVSAIRIANLDLTTLNSCFVPTDVFVISKGSLNASADMSPGGGVVVRVSVSDLAIAENPASPSRTVLFIPVRKIVKYVNRKGGRFDLELKLSGEGWHSSEDLDELIIGFWQDLWTNILGKDVSSLTDLLRKSLSR